MTSRNIGLYFILILLCGCRTNSLEIKYAVGLNEHSSISGTLKLNNLSKDTLLIPRFLNLMPRDKVGGVEYVELFMRNKGDLDTIKSGVFDFSLDPMSFFLTENDLAIKLLPLDVHSYKVDINSYYFPYLYKGKYLMKVCFRPEFYVKRDTCIFTKFKLHKDLHTAETFRNIEDLKEGKDY